MNPIDCINHASAKPVLGTVAKAQPAKLNPHGLTPMEMAQNENKQALGAGAKGGNAPTTARTVSKSGRKVGISSSPIRVKLLSEIGKHPARNIKEYSDIMGIPSSTLHHHAMVLLGAGLVDRREGYRPTYRLSRKAGGS